MISKLIRKIKKILELKKTFSIGSFVLQNGRYSFENSRFFLDGVGKRQRGLKIHVKSKEKNALIISEGIVITTPYKCLFLNNEVAFSFIKGEKRFLSIKNNLNLYQNKIPYDHMECVLIDKKCLIVSNVVNGKQFDDEEHLNLFIVHYLKSIKQYLIEKKQMEMFDCVKSILFYPQHGDCHTKNIFWNGDQLTLIDLDDVDLYPLFYDLFYYVISFKHENAFLYFRTSAFKDFFDSFSSLNLCYKEDDFIDLYLGAYVFFWVNRMKKKMKYHDIYFYLRWFEKADLSSYPIVSKAMKNYKNNLNTLGIKHEKN